MAYVPNYTTADVSEAAVDTGAVFFITVANLMGIIALGIIILWAYNRMKGAF